jgi:HK97 family phage portal protein
MSKRRKRSAVAVRKDSRNAVSVDDGRGWLTVFNSQPEWAFQRDLPLNSWTAQRNWVVFACQTLIAGDIGKLRIMLVDEEGESEVFQEVQSPAFSPVLRKPNHFETWPKFIQRWLFSKLGPHGNTYVLKDRDNRGVTVAMYVLDPSRVTPLVAPDGSVYYRLQTDDLASVPDSDPVVPASEIMHDRMWCLFHPLVGVSPLFACTLSAMQGLSIQNQSNLFFQNSSRPGGILVSPQVITDAMAKAYKERWEQNYAGANQGRTAVLGNGLTYTPIAQNAVDSDLVAQLKLSAEMICSAYHVPPYKIGIGPMPTYQNAEVLNQIYYDDCLQTLIQDVESQLEDGLGLTDAGYFARFDLDDLLRMDSATMVANLAKEVGAGITSPNEARAKLNRLPVAGGDTPYLQVQNYSIAALDRRDRSEDPFAKAAPTPTPDPAAQQAAKAAGNVLRFARFNDRLRKMV